MFLPDVVDESLPGDDDDVADFAHVRTSCRKQKSVGIVQDLGTGLDN